MEVQESDIIKASLCRAYDAYNAGYEVDAIHGNYIGYIIHTNDKTFWMTKELAESTYPNIKQKL